MLLQLLLALFLFGNSADGGPGMDPNGILLGDGIILSDQGPVERPPIDPPESNFGWHIDPNGYTGCIDPNG